MKTLACFLLISISVLVFVDTQSTPDGETPAQETICDLYKPLKGRLFGICNAYCEAMDCDSAAPKVVDSACFSVGHLLANTAADAFNMNADDIDPNEVCRDTDGDGHPDFLDNCPLVSNPDQAKNDTDSHGNACDNCPNVDNEDQLDSNGNGIGDACYVPMCPCEDMYAEAVDQWVNTYGVETTNCVGFGGMLASLTLDGTAPPNTFDMTLRTVSTVPGPSCTATITINATQPPVFGGVVGNLMPEQLEACNELILQAHTDLCDADGDGIFIPNDNCPDDANPGQEDLDNDGVGDACDPQTCGNNVVEAPEECDDGLAGSATCTPTCTSIVVCPCAQIYDEALSFWTNDLGLSTDGCRIVTESVSQGYRVAISENIVPEFPDGIAMSLSRSIFGTLTCGATILPVGGNFIFQEEIFPITLEQAEACDALHRELCPP